MFKIFKTNKMQTQLTDFENKFKDIELEMKRIREELEKVDIKAMEAQRSYRAKLKRLVGEDERDETNKNPNVFLRPNGTPI